ncbi:MAG: FG-GAP repeat protein [Candidatus Binatia bacterium]
MSMRRGAAVAVGLVGACLQVLLMTEATRGQENNSEAFSFIQQAKLTEAAKTAEDQFGASVAIDGDTALIGVPGDDEKGTSAGAVRVFHRDEDGIWEETQKLTASNGAASNFLGASVALSGDVALVGARGANPKGNFSGAAYVFVRGTDGVWREAQILSADDGTAGNFFGWSVAVQGDTALVGARGNGDDKNFPGAAYVFVRGSDSLWTPKLKLTDPEGIGGDEFGYSVALQGDTALIGARGKNENEKGILVGAAYLFSRDAEGEWTKQQKLTASDGASGDEFGYSVALDETTAVVGARFAREDSEDSETTMHPGAVYVYELTTEPDGVSWKETQKLLASAGANGDGFGGSVVVSGDLILIGARDESLAQGAVYVFTRTRASEIPSPWEEHQKILARDRAGQDAFGSSIALHGDVAIVGSPFDDLLETDTEDADGDDNTEETLSFNNLGSAYLLTMTSLPPTCEFKKDYGDAECSKTFLVASLEDLDEYVATDFGRANNNGRYTNLDIIGNLSDSFLDLQSPCEITLDPGITLSGDFVNIDGRKGVSGKRPRIVETKKACVLSEQGNVSPGDDAIIEVGELTLQAGEGAIIGDNAIVTVDGALTIEAVGEGKSSAAVIDSGAVVNAGSVQITSPRAVQIREQSRLSVDGALSLVSTLDDSGSEAVVEDRVQIQATDLTISSPRTAEIGKDASMVLSGNLTLESTGADSKSTASIKKNTKVVVGGNGELVSGNKVSLDKNVSIEVSENFHAEAGSSGQCQIKDAQISAGSTSGNCF